MLNWPELFCVSCGGALGASARYVINYYTKSWVLGVSSVRLSLSTLLVNLLGSLIFAVALMVGSRFLTLNPFLKLALLTGFCGSLTTFSTFSYENWQFWQQGEWLNFGINILANVMICLFAFIIGATMLGSQFK